MLFIAQREVLQWGSLSQVLLLPTHLSCPHFHMSVKDVHYFSPVRSVIGDDLKMSQVCLTTLKVAASCHFLILSILSITSPRRNSLFTPQCFYTAVYCYSYYESCDPLFPLISHMIPYLNWGSKARFCHLPM